MLFWRGEPPETRSRGGVVAKAKNPDWWASFIACAWHRERFATPRHLALQHWLCAKDAKPASQGIPLQS